jgi:curved DNA-binding protein CbpA
MMRQAPTLYDILGIGSDAQDEEIRAAFRKLTLKNHPDRYAGEERRRAEERFQEITEAFNVLSRPEAKQRYDREIAQGLPQAKAMDPREVARRLAGKGAQAFRDGKLAEAVEHLQMAVNHDEKCSRAHYFLALTYARLPGRERDAMRHIERAGQLEPNNAAIRAEEAQMFLAAGMAGRARRAAEQALQYDPTNVKASTILSRIDNPEKPPSDGLLGRLRRKG